MTIVMPLTTRMALEDESRRREGVLKQEVERGLQEISRLIVSVRAMEV